MLREKKRDDDRKKSMDDVRGSKEEDNGTVDKQTALLSKPSVITDINREAAPSPALVLSLPRSPLSPRSVVDNATPRSKPKPRGIMLSWKNLQDGKI